MHLCSSPPSTLISDKGGVSVILTQRAGGNSSNGDSDRDNRDGDDDSEFGHRYGEPPKL